MRRRDDAGGRRLAATRFPSLGAGQGFLAAEDRWRNSFPAVGSRGATIADVIALPHLLRWTGRTGLAPVGWERAAALKPIRR